MALITNKWTWIIGGGLLFLFVIAGIASNSKEPSSNTSTPPYQGSTPSNMVVPQKNKGQKYIQRFVLYAMERER